jgi:hypothetical protein
MPFNLFKALLKTNKVFTETLKLRKLLRPYWFGTGRVSQLNELHWHTVQRNPVSLCINHHRHISVLR